jgi:hypothetical protein
LPALRDSQSKQRCFCDTYFCDEHVRQRELDRCDLRGMFVTAEGEKYQADYGVSAPIALFVLDCDNKLGIK